MTWPPSPRYAAPRRGPAVLAAAIALAVGVALIATSGRGGSSKHVTRAAPSPASALFPHTLAGAAAAATAWCQDSEAFFNGTLGRVVSALTTGAFRARAERAQPASDMVHSRLVGLHTPYLARVWPLGYAVKEYSPAFARVRVWQVYVLAVAGPEDMTGFQSTTISLQWTGGDWKIADSSQSPDLTPPGPGATASRVASWINSVKQLRKYTYAP